MGIGVIGGGAPAKLQQYEQLFTTSGTWTVPEGVKSVEYLIAGGGANSSEGRAGVGFGLYDCTGKTSIPIIVGAKSTGDRIRGGVTKFDSSLIASGGMYDNTNGVSYSGDFIDTAKANIVTLSSGYPLPLAVADANSTTIKFDYFAGYDGWGIAIASDNTTAYVTQNSGATWSAVQGITGDTTTFSSIVSTNRMQLTHDGNHWLLTREDGSYYAVSTDGGLNWVVKNLGSSYRDMILTGGGSVNYGRAVYVTSSGHYYTSDVLTNNWSLQTSTRGDVLFRFWSTGYVISWRGDSGYPMVSDNYGSTWSQNSNQSWTPSNLTRYRKNYTASSGEYVINRGDGNQESFYYFYVAGRPNSNDYVSWARIYVQGTGSWGTSTTGNYGDNNTSLTVYCFSPQALSGNANYGVFFTYEKNGSRIFRTDVTNYNFFNTSDGSNATTTIHFGNDAIWNASSYVMAFASGKHFAFAGSATNDGKLNKVQSFEGYGTTTSQNGNGYRYTMLDAAGTGYQANWNTTYPSQFHLQSQGLDGWGRTNTTMPGLGFGGANQNGAVRLRWWA